MSDHANASAHSIPATESQGEVIEKRSPFKCTKCDERLAPRKHRCTKCGSIQSPLLSRIIPFLLLIICGGLLVICARSAGDRDAPIIIGVLGTAGVTFLVIACGLFFGSEAVYYFWTIVGLPVLVGFAVMVYANCGTEDAMLTGVMLIISSVLYACIGWVVRPEKWRLWTAIYVSANLLDVTWLLSIALNCWIGALLHLVCIGLITATFSIRARWWARVPLGGWAGCLVFNEARLIEDYYPEAKSED